MKPILNRAARFLAALAVAALCVLPAAAPAALAAGTLTGTSCTTSGTATTCTGTFSDGGSGACTAPAGTVCTPPETTAAATTTPGGLSAATTSTLAHDLTPHLSSALQNPAVASVLEIVGFGLACFVVFVLFEAVYHLIKHMRAQAQSGNVSNKSVLGPIIVIVVMMLLVSGVGIDLILNVFSGLHSVVQSGAGGVAGG